MASSKARRASATRSLALGRRVRPVSGDRLAKLGLGRAQHHAAGVDEAQCALVQLPVVVLHERVLLPDLLALDHTHTY